MNTKLGSRLMFTNTVAFVLSVDGTLNMTQPGGAAMVLRGSLAI